MIGLKSNFIGIILLFATQGILFSQDISLSGFVHEKGSREVLPFVHIRILGTNQGTNTNNYGFYSLQIQKMTEIDIEVSCIGYKTINYKLNHANDAELNIEMEVETKELNEIIITPTVELESGPLGQIQITSSLIKDIPALLGEKDLIKTLQLLPGTQRGIEGSTAMYVRGGSPDQNLMILDDALVYNANHLFGFFSVFNGDAIQTAEYWKGGFPARYGGRISSVIDIRMKEGNKEKMHGSGGIGLISSRLSLEGPIKKSKSSFLVSTRRTYLDLVTRPFMNKNSMVTYNFYDINAKLNFEQGSKNKFFVSGYFGNDKLYTFDKEIGTSSVTNAKTQMSWGNATSTFRWNHVFNNRIFTNTTILYSQFNFLLSDKYSQEGDQELQRYTEYRSSISDYSLKTDLDYFISNKHSLKSGFIYTHHTFRPRTFLSTSSTDGNQDKKTQTFQNHELGTYFEDTWTPVKQLVVNGGIRLNGFVTKEKMFLVAEPRISLSYDFTFFTLRGSYARTNQFLHLLSNTGIGLSTDLWVPATSIAPPQQADLFSISATKNLIHNQLTVSIEGYRKYLRNIISYKEGASFLTFDDGAKEILWEDNVTSGKGLAYGTEVLLQKNGGKLTGWIGYSLSWIIHQFDELNNGNRFYPRYDSRHNVSVLCIYKISPKIHLAANWLFNTGNALNIPQGYYYGNFGMGTTTRSISSQTVITNEIVTEEINRVSYFGSRNSFRAEAYHRLDMSIQFHKVKKKYERYWEFGLFNVYNRKNPFYYYLQSDNTFGNNGQKIELKKRSLLPIMPSVSYNFKF